MPPDDTLAAVAYQRILLKDVRDLYGELDLSLDQYLDIELEMSKRLDSAEDDASGIREALSSLGVDSSHIEPDESPSHDGPLQSPRVNGFLRIQPADPDDFQALSEEASIYLTKMGVNLDKDPLLQVISFAEVTGNMSAYRKEYGDISWSQSDYLAIMCAGLTATLLDIFLVRIPKDDNFLGKTQQGSPLTTWLKDNSEEVHKRVLKQFERGAKVPYDDVRHPDVAGMRPGNHRSQSFGHDPVLGFIFGVIDILGNTGTYVDQYGDIIKIHKAPADPVSLIEAFLKVFFHLLSDIFTSVGLQPPFFTLMQLVKTESPFVLGPSGEQVSWTNVARYMYKHSYDLRHFATMGIVPATVEMMIRGWRLCESYENDENPDLMRAKTASMLMMAHTMAASGNLIKTGAIYSMNPLAMNWAQALWMFPVTVSWLTESVKRDRRITTKLDNEWSNLYFAADELTSH